MYNYILFDLDGTVANTEKSITASVKYALNTLGFDYCGMDFTKFIGPSMFFSFENYCGFDYEKQKRAVALYREIYEKTNVYDCKLYDGVYEVLKKLKDDGKKIALSTAKPLKFAKIILNQHNISQFFDDIEGITDDSMTKTDIINLAMRNLNAKAEQTVMVGDRNHDVIGAKNCKIDSIGVLYGFGTEAELKSAGCTHICKDIKAVYELIAKK